MSYSELPADVTDVATGESVTIQTEHGLYVDPKALSAHLPALSYRDDALYMEQVSVDELAKQCETISNEILTSISSRVQRIYK